nr:hypothetical protein [Micromonospora sp. DSM 115978]
MDRSALTDHLPFHLKVGSVDGHGVPVTDDAVAEDKILPDVAGGESDAAVDLDIVHEEGAFDDRVAGIERDPARPAQTAAADPQVIADLGVLERHPLDLPATNDEVVVGHEPVGDQFLEFAVAKLDRTLAAAPGHDDRGELTVPEQHPVFEYHISQVEIFDHLRTPDHDPRLDQISGAARCPKQVGPDRLAG